MTLIAVRNPPGNQLAGQFVQFVRSTRRNALNRPDREVRRRGAALWVAEQARGKPHRRARAACLQPGEPVRDVDSDDPKEREVLDGPVEEVHRSRSPMPLAGQADPQREQFRKPDLLTPRTCEFTGLEDRRSGCSTPSNRERSKRVRKTKKRAPSGASSCHTAIRLCGIE